MTIPPVHLGVEAVPQSPHRLAPPPPVASSVPKAGRRIASRSIDFALLLVVFVLLATVTAQGIGDRFAEVLPRRAIGAVIDVLLSGGDVRAAADKLGDSVWRMVVSRTRTSIILLIGFHFAYEAAANLWKGRTLGRSALGLRLVGRARARIGVGRALGRALVTVVCTGGLYGLAWIVLLHGNFVGGVVLWLLSVVALVVYAVAALAGRGRRSPGDLVAGTEVIHSGVHAEAGEAVFHAARSGTTAAQAAAVSARRGAARVARQVPVQRMRETGGRWVAHAAESGQGQRLRRLGSGAKSRIGDAYRNRRKDGGSTESGPL